MTLLRNILCDRQSYADKSTLAKLAVKRYRAAVAVDDMLYYGKAESGTALFGASALIHSVETLKHTVKRLLRDAYAVIPYIDTAYLADIVKRYLHPAAVLVVLYGVADNIFDKLVYVLVCGTDSKAVAGQFYRDVLCASRRLQTFLYRCAYL